MESVVIATEINFQEEKTYVCLYAAHIKSEPKHHLSMNYCHVGA